MTIEKIHNIILYIFVFLLSFEYWNVGNVGIATVPAMVGYAYFLLTLRQPKRFFNIGVAEANMVGIAAGLSLSGKNVYCYSIAPFLIMRAFEQIRVDIC